MNIIVTPAAEAFMRRIVRMGGKSPEAGFRLSVSPGGCSGIASEFSVEAAPLPGDATLEVNGLRVFLPQSAASLLEGATVDFADGGSATGFVIRNPKVEDCGCGSETAGRGGRHTVDVSSIRRGK
jgi:iron-sulfur cluster assembly protein